MSREEFLAKLFAARPEVYATRFDNPSGLEKIRAFFEDDHVHVALIVATDGRRLRSVPWALASVRRGEGIKIQVAPGGWPASHRAGKSAGR